MDGASASFSLWALAPLAGLALAVIGLALLLRALFLLRRSPARALLLQLLPGLLLLLAALVVMGIQDYGSLTREEVVATVSVQPTGAQRFDATVRLADGIQATYALAGDELYVDARILKWKPVANLLGLHTSWALDRIAGRYRAVEGERTQPRTVFALSPTPIVDLMAIRERFAWLSPVYDASYGSASFVPATSPAEYDVLVSTSGLLIRQRSASN